MVGLTVYGIQGGGAGTLTGGGTTPQVAYWTGATSLGGDAGLLVDTVNNFFVTADAGGIRNNTNNVRVQLNANGSIQADSGGNARGAGAVDWQVSRSDPSYVASGDYAFIAGGEDNTASGAYSHVEGVGNVASGLDSHAEGYTTTASFNYTHAEGTNTVASGIAAHAEGNGSVASGNYSHAENASTASGTYSHAQGINTVAAGDFSHAGGRRAIIAAAHDGTFLWADQTDADFNSVALNEFAIRSRGGFRHAYDNSYYLTQSVASDGDVTFAITAAAGTPTFTFSQGVILSSALQHQGATVGFYNVAPIARQVLATGVGATVDQVITALQNLGLVSQV